MPEHLITVNHACHAVGMTADGPGGASGQPAAVTPGELIVRRLKDARAKAGGISTRALAERLAALTGDARLSANVLQNLEAGRRQQAVTVDELLLLAYGLDVPPEFFLAPFAEPVQLTATRAVEAGQFLAWIRGRQALPGTAGEFYASVSTLVLGPAAPEGTDALKAEFRQRIDGLIDAFFAEDEKAMTESDEIIRKTQDQVRDLLGQLRTAIADGTARDELLSLVDSYLQRLPD
jgi:transcriptional regulator with XRE-family HTH domain